MTRSALALALTLLAAPAPAARAMPPADAFDPFANAKLWVKSSTATTATVCAAGTANGPGTWTLTIAAPPTPVTDRRDGATYTETCRTVTTAALAAGAGSASFAFVTAAGSSAQPVAHCHLTLGWAPALPPDYLLSLCTEAPTARTHT